MSFALAIRKLIRAVTDSRSPSNATPSMDGFGFGLDARTEHPKGGRRRLILGLALPVLAILGVLKLTGGQADKVNVVPAIVETPGPTVASDATPMGSGWRGYAIEATELEGLAPEAITGTMLEIWVTWEPPVTKEVKMQRLIRTARLEKIVPPVVPEAPPTALLSVRARDLPDLLYGDRFGALSVAVLPEAQVSPSP